ncbi:MAG TPA: gliding motility-associated C-terminal domain-containing protein, partial [Lentimicrobium sp.]|nr:gliding motility-associated C-terminal domain-containing protein [Lentimicrobium sp.]
DTQVKLPTAFKPGSDNSITNTFKPLLRFFDAGSYSLMIYNRWGQQVFSTNDPTKGWDGLVNGNEASAGLYAWVLTFNDLNGNKTTEKGAVMLLR